jgi:hypothetical protein
MRLPDLNAVRSHGCERYVSTNRGNFRRHADDSVLRECPMSGKTTPESDQAHRMVTAARTALNLAEQMRDEDPGWVWRYLADLAGRKPAELQQLAFVALAAITPDQTLEQAFDWVLDLPNANVGVSA